MKDDDLRRHVAAELSWDPQVGSDAIAVSAAAAWSLRGTVTSIHEAGRGRAAHARASLRVANELGYRSPTDRRDDRTCAATCWRR
jgi:hypothetical protein